MERKNLNVESRKKLEANLGQTHTRHFSFNVSCKEKELKLFASFFPNASGGFFRRSERTSAQKKSLFTKNAEVIQIALFS